MTTWLKYVIRLGNRMLTFEIETEDADWWVEVWAKNSKWLGGITRDFTDSKKLKFTPSSKDCQFDADELIAIANKMKEMGK